MNYNLRDVTLIILLIILIFSASRLVIKEKFFDDINSFMDSDSDDAINEDAANTDSSDNSDSSGNKSDNGCPIPTKETPFMNNKMSKNEIDIVGDQLSYNKMFDFNRSDRGSGLIISGKKLEYNDYLDKIFKDVDKTDVEQCENVCILFYSSKVKKFNLDTSDLDNDSVEKHFGNFSKAEKLNDIIYSNTCTTDDSIIRDQTKFGYFATELKDDNGELRYNYNNVFFHPKTIFEKLKKGVYNNYFSITKEQLDDINENINIERKYEDCLIKQERKRMRDRMRDRMRMQIGEEPEEGEELEEGEESEKGEVSEKGEEPEKGEETVKGEEPEEGKESIFVENFQDYSLFKSLQFSSYKESFSNSSETECSLDTLSTDIGVNNTQLKPVIFKNIDCNDSNNKNLCLSLGIKKYPVLKFFKKKKVFTKYDL